VNVNKEQYEDLMLRFAKELHEVGVSENMKKAVEDRYTRTPNIAGVDHQETVRKFYYQHDGYSIEAIQTVKLIIKKCK